MGKTRLENLKKMLAASVSQYIGKKSQCAIWFNGTWSWWRLSPSFPLKYILHFVQYSKFSPVTSLRWQRSELSFLAMPIKQTSRPHEKKMHLEDYNDIHAEPFPKTKLHHILWVIPGMLSIWTEAHKMWRGFPGGLASSLKCNLS